MKRNNNEPGAERSFQLERRRFDRTISQPGLFDRPAPGEESAAQPHSRKRQVKAGGQRYLQDILWKESLLAIRLSLDCQTVSELATRLRKDLPQNSAATRQRNASIILGRFFPTDDLDQLPRRVLRAYEDEALLAAVMRVLLLEAEPLVGQLITERICKLSPGSELPKDFFTQYAQEALGKKDLNVSHRCCTAARVLGWIAVEKQRCYVAQQIPHETAALLLFHHRYAPTPRGIDMKQLLSGPTWKYLGFGSEDAVRGFMRKLERRGLIGRYAVVDRLEQVTTRYPLESLLERKVRV